MAQPNEALRAALAAAERLPPTLQRQLAERLLESTGSRQNSVTIHLRRLTKTKQSRLAELMDKNSEAELSAAEQAELKVLGYEVDETMLSNSIALARAARPELFDSRGRLIKRRFRHAVGVRSRREKTDR
ncbi:MAG TPA: hypothetical protein VJH03_07190 [Blastocatellia bacterium]|nr:hypothetical protein [Blastocatellia bacterium]